MVGATCPRCGRNDSTTHFGPDAKAIDCRIDLSHADDCFTAAYGQDGAFIHDLSEVGASQAGGRPRKVSKAHASLERLSARVHLENGLPAGTIGYWNHDMSIE